MAPQQEAELLAGEVFEARRDLRSAGRTLHDDVGPLLSATGIRLHLLLMNHPQAREDVGEALATLDEAMEYVRRLSQKLLNPFPAAGLGLQNALWRLVTNVGASFPGMIRLSYSEAARPGPEAAVAIYEAVAAALEHAVRDRSATRIRVSVRGGRGVTARLTSDGHGKWPRGVLAAQARRGRPAGISLDVHTKESTIVSIRYAPRRTAGG